MKVYVSNRDFKVYFIITFKLKRFQVYTGLQTTEKFSGMVFPKSDKSAKAKTSRLAKLFAEVEDYLLTHSDETPANIKEQLRDLLAGAERKKQKTFLNYLQEFTDSRNRPNTKRTYQRTLVCVSNYDAKATFQTIDKAWLDNFIKHEQGKGRKSNGIYVDIAHIKAVFKKALEDGITTNYPFGSIRMKREETKKRCLTLEQMRAFRDFKPYRKQAQMYLDCFMLGFYLIGINISDLLTLKKSDLRNGRISYYRNKTGRLYDIKVEPEAMEIINRHKRKDGEMLLDFLSTIKNESIDLFTTHLNLALRRIGERDSRDLRKATSNPIEPNVSSYWNRHTWATFASELDVPMEVIGRALGHSLWDKAVTSTYIKFDTRKVDEANRKVIDYLNSDKV